MKFYGGLSKEKVLEIYNFVIEKRRELKYGQRKLFRLVKEKFEVEIKEATIAHWIFLGLIPFASEKTQFKAKPKPKREELYNLYINQNQSAEKLGKRYAVSTVIVINWLKFYKIPARNHLQSMNTSIIKEQLRQKKLRRPTKDFSKMTPEKSYLFGVLCGDAHVNKRFIRLEIRRDKEFIEEFLRCIGEVYGLEYKYSYYKPRNSLVTQVNSQLICADLLKHGSFMTREWTVPDEIIDSNDEKVLGAFLRGFYDSEGCSSLRCTITCSSANEIGLKQVSELLLKLGIKSTLRPIKQGKYFVLYIFRKERFKLFKEKIGFTIRRKQEKIDKTLNTGFFTKRSIA